MTASEFAEQMLKEAATYGGAGKWLSQGAKALGSAEGSALGRAESVAARELSGAPVGAMSSRAAQGAVARTRLQGQGRVVKTPSLKPKGPMAGRGQAPGTAESPIQVNQHGVEQLPMNPMTPNPHGVATLPFDAGAAQAVHASPPSAAAGAHATPPGGGASAKETGQALVSHDPQTMESFNAIQTASKPMIAPGAATVPPGTPPDPSKMGKKPARPAPAGQVGAQRSVGHTVMKQPGGRVNAGQAAGDDMSATAFGRQAVANKGAVQPGAGAQAAQAAQRGAGGWMQYAKPIAQLGAAGGGLAFADSLFTPRN